MSKKENIAVRMIKGVGCAVLSEVMCAFLVLSMAAFSAATGGAVWVKIIIAVCCLAVTLGLYFSWAVKAAQTDRDAVKYHGAAYDKYMPVKMGFIAPVISYASLIALIISKCGAIPDIFSVYLLLNLPFMPFVDAFTPGRTLEYLNIAGLIGLALLTLSQSAAIIASYVLAYRDVDVITRIMYKK